MKKSESVENAESSEVNLTEEHLKKEDLFVDYAERDIEDDLVEDEGENKNKGLANSKLPPRNAADIFKKKQKKQLREGVKHMTKFSLQDNSRSSKSSQKSGRSGSASEKKTTKLMDNLLREDMDDRIRRIERYKEMEEEEANKSELKSAQKLIMDEKKWYKEVISKIDIVPDELNYYDNLAVKPGFDFIYALINSNPEFLEQLRLFIPDTLYFNYNSFLIHSDSSGKVNITLNPKSKQFLDLIEKKATYDIVRNWTEPATVVRKATSHPCYQSINLLNWKQTYEQIRNGPANRTMIQNYQISFGEKLCLYRAVIHPEELVNTKGTGKYNFCYALTNKIPFKATLDEEQKIMEEFQQLKLDEEHGESSQRTSTRTQKKPNQRFENKYLICPFEVGSFDVYTYTGKTMGPLEKEAYKVFKFMEKAFEMRLLNIVTDWIRDDKGIYWFIGIKSFKLREESYLHKTTKPSAFDRELLAININKKVKKFMCAKCLKLFKPSEVEKNIVTKHIFEEMKKLKVFKDHDWIKGIKRYQEFSEGSNDLLFCGICYAFVVRDVELFETQAQLATLEYIPQQQKDSKGLPPKPPEVKPKNIRNNQRFRPKLFQWRILVIAHKILDVNTKLMESKGHAVYLQFRFGEYVTRFQLSHPNQPVKYSFEKVKMQTNYSKNQPQIIAETEEIKEEEEGKEEETQLSNNELVRVLKINKARVNYFFTRLNKDISSFLNTCEVEFRITVGQSWNNYIAVNKGQMLNFFSNTSFQRGSENNYTRNLMLFTESLEAINLRLTLGLTLDSECDLSELNELQLKPYMNQIFLPPEDFFNKEICLNGIPPQWINLIREENTLIKQHVADVGKTLYHPDGKEYSKMDYYRVQKYGHIDNKLHNSTVANRAAGMNISVSPSKETPKNSRRGLSIPEQIAKIQEKKKFKKRSYVMPSQKAAFFKKSKLAQNIKGEDLDKKDSDLSTSKESDGSPDKKKKLKLKFGDLFQAEGMYQSVNDELRRSFTLLKTPNRDIEKHEEEEELKYLEFDERYNEQVWEPGFIQKVEINNLKKINPYDPKVQSIIKDERKQKEKDKAQLEALEAVVRNNAGGRRGKSQIQQKSMSRVITRRQRLLKQQEEQKAKEEEEKKAKEKEERKFKQLQVHMTHKILRDIRSVNYANYSTL